MTNGDRPSRLFLDIRTTSASAEVVHFCGLLASGFARICRPLDNFHSLTSGFRANLPADSLGVRAYLAVVGSRILAFLLDVSGCVCAYLPAVSRGVHAQQPSVARRTCLA